MSGIAVLRINSLLPAEQQADVQPEEPIFVLSSSQLQEIITRAVQPLKDEVQDLRDMVASLESKVSALESTHEQDMDRVTLDIAFDRQRLSKLENPVKVSGKTEISRAEKIEKYLAARPDHKASFKTLKGHLGIDKNRLKEAIKVLMEASPGRYGITQTPGDKRKRSLVMLPK